MRLTHRTNRGGTSGPSSAIYGLEWPGTGLVRRMLYWSSPPPMYGTSDAGMTYIFKVYPRDKGVVSSDYQYWTMFFWGNNGTFFWDGGNAGSFYGMHPYPFNKHNAGWPTSWEISVNGNDFGTHTTDEPPTQTATPDSIIYNTWYTQVIRVWRESSTTTHHEFYYDWPDTNKVIRKTIVDAAWGATAPTFPAIVIGQAPDNGSGLSWGGYAGWEEYNGIIRGIQIYDTLLSTTDISSEIATPKSTTAGNNGIWYLNIDPRPSDVTDKSGNNNNPQWDSAGTTAIEWVG